MNDARLAAQYCDNLAIGSRHVDHMDRWTGKSIHRIDTTVVCPHVYVYNSSTTPSHQWTTQYIVR